MMTYNENLEDISHYIREPWR